LGALNKFAASEKLLHNSLNFLGSSRKFRRVRLLTYFRVPSRPVFPFVLQKDDFGGSSSTIDNFWGCQGEGLRGESA